MEQKATNSAPNVEEQDCCNEPSCCGPQVPLRGLFLRWGGMIPARVATGKNSKNAVAVASEWF